MVHIIIQDAIKLKSHTLEIKTHTIVNPTTETGEKCVHVKELQTKLAALLNTHPRYISIIFYRHIPRSDEYLNLNAVYNEILKFVHIKRFDWDNRKSVILNRFCNRRNRNLGD